MGDNPIRNTETDVCERGHGLVLIAEALRDGGMSAGIERMEAAGQQQLAQANGTVLPKQGSDDDCWAKLGVLFGDDVDGDPLFRHAVIPSGWRVERSSHSMWSYLLDDKGRKRGAIFYKAAFYDRVASIRAEQRIKLCAKLGSVERQEPYFSYVADAQAGPTSPYESATVLFSVEYPHFDQELLADEECLRWLSDHLPNWKDASAYWDEDLTEAVS